MTSLPRHLSCQLVRYCANWQFYWSVCAVLALTALFAVLDVQTISSTVSITANGTVQSHDALDPNLAHIVSDAMLASPYQTSIILIPIIVALIVAAGFRSGDERQLRLLYNRPYPFAVSDVLATVLYCIAVSLLSSLLNAAILVVMLESRAATDVPHGYGYYHTSEGDGVRRGHGTDRLYRGLVHEA